MQPWEIDGYERLRTEIVKVAVFDLKKAMRKSNKLGYVCEAQENLEKWFLSKWGQILSGDNGEYIIEKCSQTYNTGNGKKKADKISPEVEERAYIDWKAGMTKKEIMKKHGITSYQYFNMLRRHGR